VVEGKAHSGRGERAMIRERVRASIARAKADGKHCGRPPASAHTGLPWRRRAPAV